MTRLLAIGFEDSRGMDNPRIMMHSKNMYGNVVRWYAGGKARRGDRTRWRGPGSLEGGLLIRG